MNTGEPDMALETKAQSRSSALASATAAAGGSEPAARRTVGDVTVPNPVMSCRQVNVHYGDKHAIRNVSL
ncbi:MAG: phosphate ABC transporter ATP-binding protein, partial [Gammaproteobacteria bacterium]|nr:phosphate ABC transporter ATP-binding protein [Gammaproteobacteria bacterium]